MAAIKIMFPKIGHTTSTWVHDDEWIPLSLQQRTALIGRFVKNHHPKVLAQSMAQTGKKGTPNFQWEEM